MTLELKMMAKCIESNAKTYKMTEAQYLRMCRKYRNRKGKPHLNLEANRESLHNMRVHEWRQKARSAHLARMFLKGMPYSRVETDPYWKRENPSRPAPNHEEIADLVHEFGTSEYMNCALSFVQELVGGWIEDT